MSARLHFSNSLEALADRLIANLRATGSDPFEVDSIATPASALRDWLKVRIAEKNGIAANLAFPPLETLLWERLAERDRLREAPDRRPARLLDTLAFQGLVLARLRGNPPDALREYLASPHPDDAARRLCQLAGQLASLFREYEYNRVAGHGFPGLIESWMQGKPSFEPHLLRGAAGRGPNARLGEVKELEAWQLEVYHALFRRDTGLRDVWGAATKTYRYTLPQYAELALGDPLVPEGVGRTYHLFGLSNISPFHRDLIGRLADEGKLGDGAARFEIYALNPCAEFWEDALTLRERRARGPRRLVAGAIDASRVAATRPAEAELAEGEIRDEDGENGLLALFGKPGRETVKLWCQLTDHDFEEDFREAGEGSEGGLLAALRSSLLHRAGPLATRVAPDATLRFGVARSPRAELEAVRAEVAEVLRKNPALRPEQLAVIPADPAAALPLLRAVFAGDDRAPGNAPLLLPDGGGAGEGPLLAGFRAILESATHDISRDDLVDLLGNPAAARAHGIDVARLPAVADLLEAAGFSRGWGGVQDADGASTLAAALGRLVAAMAVDADDPLVAGDLAIPLPVPGLAARLDPDEAGALLDWLGALSEGSSRLREGGMRPFAEWARLLHDLRAALLKPGQDDARDDLDLRRFLEELETWGSWGEAEDADATLVATLFADRFRDAEAPGRTAFLRGGVRTGSLAALRGIPFKHIWITGLTSAFPASGDAMPLDLRTYRRMPGESDPAARDLYALLEAVASCMGSVSLSWHRRGADGRERRPSRALTGMMAWLESDILPEGSPFDFSDIQPPAAPRPPHAEAPAAAFADENTRNSFRKFGDVALFLRNPVTHATDGLYRSGQWDALDDEGEELSQDLFVDAWQGSSLLDACVRADLSRSATAGATFERLWESARRGGKTPPEPWGEAARDGLRDALSLRMQGEVAPLRAIMETEGLHFMGALRLGPQGAERPEPPVLNRPAFDAVPLGFDLRLGGVLPWFFRGERGWALLIDEGRDMTAYLLQLCIAALHPLPSPLAETFAGTGRLLVRMRKASKEGRIVSRPLPALASGEARDVLRDLLEGYSRALHGEGRLDDVPLEEIATILDEEGGATDWAEAILERRARAGEDGRERVGRAERRRRAVDPQIPAAINETVDRRVRPYLAWREALSEIPEGPGDADGDAGTKETSS